MQSVQQLLIQLCDPMLAASWQHRSPCDDDVTCNSWIHLSPASAPSSPAQLMRILALDHQAAGMAKVHAWQHSRRTCIAQPEPAPDVVSHSTPHSCTCMQVYGSLGAGNWTFQVRSTDAAGNAELAPFRSFAWTVALPASYPVISGGNSGTVSRSVPVQRLAGPAVGALLQCYC